MHKAVATGTSSFPLRRLLSRHHEPKRRFLALELSSRQSLRRSNYGFDRQYMQRRTIADLSTILLPPKIFVGLAVTLWTWKCIMMILFQNKIIYMPGLPPNARREKLSDYEKQCQGVKWEEARIHSDDGTEIALCVARIDAHRKASRASVRLYILYFQGNASSLPPRLPMLSPVLKMAGKELGTKGIPVQLVMVCVSYRGYWTSHGRPSEQGIIRDTAAALRWIDQDSSQEQDRQSSVPVIFWGQSIGAGFATSLAARQDLFPSSLSLKGLILETPFTSIRTMLETIYPQKWLPYRYLWPFLRNHLDSRKQLAQIAGRESKPAILLLEAGRDELVPKSHCDELESLCTELGLEAERKSVPSAYHTEAMDRTEGRIAVSRAIITSATRLDESIKTFRKR